MDPGTTLGRIGDFAGAAELFGPVLHIGQAAAARIVDGYATAVIDDVEDEHVGDADLDGQPRRTGVANGVADGFRGDRFSVLAEFTANGGHRSVHAHRTHDVTIFGQVGDHSLDPKPKVPTISQGRLFWSHRNHGPWTHQFHRRPPPRRDYVSERRDRVVRLDFSVARESRKWCVLGTRSPESLPVRDQSGGW